MSTVPRMNQLKHAGYRKMKGDEDFYSQLYETVDSFNDRTIYVSPDSAVGKNPILISEICSPIKLSHESDELVDTFSSFNESSISLFDEIDHVAELLARSLGSAAQSTVMSLFKHEPNGEVFKKKSDSDPSKIPVAFKLSSVVTSPSNRMRIEEAYHMKCKFDIANETQKIADRINERDMKREVPNFSVVVSPITKQEDTHMVSVEGDWSFDTNMSALVESNAAEAPVIDSNPKTKSMWVTFEPFEEFNRSKSEQSFTPYTAEEEKHNPLCHTLSAQLEKLNNRLASVERILQNLQYNI